MLSIRAANDELIARWIEEVPSDKEEVVNRVFSDVAVDMSDQHVLEQTSRSDSEIECEEKSTLAARRINLQGRNLPPSVQTSLDEDVLLSEERSRSRKWIFFWLIADFVGRLSLKTLQQNILDESEGTIYKCLFYHFIKKVAENSQDHIWCAEKKY